MTFLFIWLLLTALLVQLWATEVNQVRSRKRLEIELLLQIKADIEDFEKRDMRWRIGLAQEFRQEDPQ